MWIFNSKSKIEKLEAEYFRLSEKAFEIETEDFKKAAKIRVKAQRVLMQIVEMEQ